MAASRHTVDQAVVELVVDHARLAPSFHNTQPWSWWAYDDVLELRVDRHRWQQPEDPDARNLTISCGAALHHTCAASRALGLRPEVARWPDGVGDDLVARIRLTATHPPAEADSELRAMLERCTDRRRFTTWPVTQARAEALVATTDPRPRQGVHAVVLDPFGRHTTSVLVSQAGRLQAGHDQVVSSVLLSDAVAILCTAGDGPTDWLATGECLSALWLRATRDGLSLVPLSQVVHVAPTRALLRSQLAGGAGEPQLLLRLSWQEIGRSTLPRTPRRALTEVLHHQRPGSAPVRTALTR